MSPLKLFILICFQPRDTLWYIFNTDAGWWTKVSPLIFLTLLDATIFALDPMLFTGRMGGVFYHQLSLGYSAILFVSLLLLLRSFLSLVLGLGVKMMGADVSYFDACSAIVWSLVPVSCFFSIVDYLWGLIPPAGVVIGLGIFVGWVFFAIKEVNDFSALKTLACGLISFAMALGFIVIALLFVLVFSLAYSYKIYTNGAAYRPNPGAEVVTVETVTNTDQGQKLVVKERKVMNRIYYKFEKIKKGSVVPK